MVVDWMPRFTIATESDRNAFGGFAVTAGGGVVGHIRAVQIDGKELWHDGIHKHETPDLAARAVVLRAIESTEPWPEPPRAVDERIDDLNATIKEKEKDASWFEEAAASNRRRADDLNDEAYEYETDARQLRKDVLELQEMLRELESGGNV